MKQEDIDLLIKDLSSRLPYGVKVQYEDKIFDIDYISPMYEEVKLNIADNYTIGVYEIKPYLFPISSMTEEQRKEFDGLTNVLHEFMKKHAKGNDVTERFFYTQIELWKLKTDWLDKNHFDYRGLIPMGLANDATGKNIY